MSQLKWTLFALKSANWVLYIVIFYALVLSKFFQIASLEGAVPPYFFLLILVLYLHQFHSIHICLQIAPPLQKIGANKVPYKDAGTKINECLVGALVTLVLLSYRLIMDDVTALGSSPSLHHQERG